MLLKLYYCVLFQILLTAQAFATDQTEHLITHLTLPGLEKNGPNNFANEHAYRIDLTSEHVELIKGNHELECFVQSESHVGGLKISYSNGSGRGLYLISNTTALRTSGDLVTSEAFVSDFNSLAVGQKTSSATGIISYIHLANRDFSPYRELENTIPFAIFVTEPDFDLVGKMQCTFWIDPS